MEKICGGVTNIDNLWIGWWSDYYLEHIFDKNNNTQKIENIDSAITYSWTNRKIKAGETKEYSVIIEIEPPQDVPKEDETENTIKDIIEEEVKDTTNENTNTNLSNKESNEEADNTLENENTQNKEKDNTVAKGKIPKTGENDFILPLIGILLVRTSIVYVKLKRINKQEDRIKSKIKNRNQTI